MRALVTGSSGQIARSLAVRAASVASVELVFLARPQFDLEAPQALAREIVRQAPDVVLSVAAYTAVDPAEDEPDKAMAINARAPGVLAGAAAELGIPIVHLSSDYVFAGNSKVPYRETHVPGPVTQYGRSKRRGEQAVMRANPQHIILRTAWVYSPFGKNFVKTILRLASDNERLCVVDDQVGNPTSAFDIADAILHVLQNLKDAPFGIYHLAGAEDASWCDFAREVLRISGEWGGPCADVVAVKTADFPTRAARPANSRLDCAKFSQLFGHTLPGYPQALPAVVSALLDAR